MKSAVRAALLAAFALLAVPSLTLAEPTFVVGDTLPQGVSDTLLCDTREQFENLVGFALAGDQAGFQSAYAKAIETMNPMNQPICFIGSYPIAMQVLKIVDYGTNPQGFHFWGVQVTFPAAVNHEAWFGYVEKPAGASIVPSRTAEIIMYGAEGWGGLTEEVRALEAALVDFNAALSQLEIDIGVLNARLSP